MYINIKGNIVNTRELKTAKVKGNYIHVYYEDASLDDCILMKTPEDAMNVLDKIIEAFNNERQ